MTKLKEAMKKYYHGKMGPIYIGDCSLCGGRVVRVPNTLNKIFCERCDAIPIPAKGSQAVISMQIKD